MDKKSRKYFNTSYLIKIGLHESAYNLRSGENMAYESVKWNRKFEDVIKDLREIKNANEYSPWFQDDVK